MICPVMSRPVVTGEERLDHMWLAACEGSRCAWWRPRDGQDMGSCGALRKFGVPFRDPVVADGVYMASDAAPQPYRQRVEEEPGAHK